MYGAKLQQESIRMRANRPLRDRNPNTYNLILERPQNDLNLEMNLTLMIILKLYVGYSKRIWGPTVRMINFTKVTLTLAL